MGLGDIAAGMGLGLITGPIEDSRQRNQKRKIQAIEMQGAKEMAEFNRQMQMKLWEDTNYAAQRKQLEKAGMSVGLMYKQGGPGGTTQATPGSVSGGTPERTNTLGMGLQMGMQLEMQKAQIEVAQSQARLNNVEADKRAGIDTTEGQQRVTNMQLEAKAKEIENNIKQETQASIISQIKTQGDKLMGEAKSAQAAGKLDQAAYQMRIKQIQQDVAEQQLRMTAIKAGIDKTLVETAEGRAKINKIANEIVKLQADTVATKEGVRQKDEQLLNQERAILLQKMQTEFNTSDAAVIKQWADAIWSTVTPRLQEKNTYHNDTHNKYGDTYIEN